jgi:hypothetical protein
MSVYNNTEGAIEDKSSHYNHEYSGQPIETLESQYHDDEKGDPYVKELGNPNIETVDVNSEGEEKEVGTGEREGRQCSLCTSFAYLFLTIAFYLLQASSVIWNSLQQPFPNLMIPTYQSSRSERGFLVWYD